MVAPASRKPFSQPTRAQEISFVSYQISSTSGVVLRNHSATLRPNTLQGKAHCPANAQQLLKRNFHASTLLLVGATLQSLLVLAIPRFYAFLPSILILLYRFSDTLLITFDFKPNPYTHDSMTKKFSTVLPDTEGNLPSQIDPGEQKLAIVLLGMKFHHPLGLFSPYSQNMNEWGTRMYAELEANRDCNGYLGQSYYNNEDVQGNIELVMISFWRSKEDIVAFSQSKLHLDAWKWWNELSSMKGGKLRHIGINHEILEAPAGHCESIYLNSAPLRLAATTFKHTTEEGEVQWVSPVVAARGPLANSDGRLGWPVKGGDDKGGGSEGSGDEYDSRPYGKAQRTA